MTSVKRLLAGAGAVALLASGAVLGVASAAQAGPSITVTPNANLKAGDVVTVTVTGFTPKAPVAIGVTGTGRNVKGPGDAGRSKEGNSVLSEADASGSATAKITIPVGKLGNTTPPEITCPPCSMGASNIANAAEKAIVELNYADAGGSTTDTKDAVAPKEKAPKEALPKTGPRETMIMALVGFALLQVGLIFAIRASRSTPRRTVA
jgi:LPXTG-motif cell wall-anchored protein